MIRSAVLREVANAVSADSAPESYEPGDQSAFPLAP